MSQKMINNIYRIATGSSKKRILYAPFAFLFFVTVTSGFVLLPFYIEKILHIPSFIYAPWNLIVSVPFLAAGTFYVVWASVIFFGVRGTPVPLNPPPVLVAKGPYKYSRNPMTAGLFLQMFGVGFLFGSALSVLVFTPLYIFLHYLELKHVEEPELEMRLGNAYVEYKNKVPMFFPWKKV
jgi:protein-S-isoprenylcysteine O-methyltransferase Ste14